MLDGVFDDYFTDDGVTEKLSKQIEAFKKEIEDGNIIEILKVALKIKNDDQWVCTENLQVVDDEGKCIDGYYNYEGRKYYFYYNFLSEYSFDYQIAEDIVNSIKTT